MIRVAIPDDLDFLDRHDPLLERSILADKIRRAEVYVAEDRGERVGLARFEYFCDLDPFLSLVMVLEPHRRRGFGRQLLEYWEADMQRRGHRLVLTSTQADEEAQHFYRALGYTDCGCIFFPGQTPAELVLVKRLTGDEGATGPRQKPPPERRQGSIET